MNNYTHRIENAHLLAGEGHRFWHCDVEVTFERELGRYGTTFQESIHGTILFTHPVPRQMFERDDRPKPIDVTATSETDHLELEQILVAKDLEKTPRRVEFVAADAKIEVSGPPRDEPKPDRDRVRDLAEQIGEVVNGD